VQELPMGFFSRNRDSERANISGAGIALATITLHSLATECSIDKEVSQGIGDFIASVLPFDPEAPMRLLQEIPAKSRSLLVEKSDLLSEGFTSENSGIRNASFNANLMRGHISKEEFYAKELYTTFITASELTLANVETKNYNEFEFATRVGREIYADFCFCRLMARMFIRLHEEDLRLPFTMATVGSGIFLLWVDSPERKSLVISKKPRTTTRKPAAVKAKTPKTSKPAEPVTLEFEVDVQSMSPMVDIEQGPGVARLFPDGSYLIMLDDNSASFEGDSSIPLKWTDGLMRGVDEGFIYFSLGYMVVARFKNKKDMKQVEKWCQLHHPKEDD
jgi:hypothetical protein